MKVLVVEDSLDVAEPLIAFLHSLTYQTTLAHDAPSALELAATFRPDVALLDIGLPSIDGWMLGASIRALPGLADLPIVALTGYGSPADRQKSAEARFQHHLVKPINYTLLGQIIQSLEPISDEPSHHTATDVLGASSPAPLGQPSIQIRDPEG